VKKTLKYVGILIAQGAAAFALAVYLIGPAIRGEPMPWQEKDAHAETADAGAAGDDHGADDEKSEGGGDHAPKESKKGHGKKKEGHSIGALLPIESVIVNVAETQGRRFLKASLTLEVEGEEAAEAATTRLPVLRGAVIDVLAAKNLDQLVAPDARALIRGEILETLNEKSENVEFSDLFFTEFIVQ
jgi:flagellar FliL protein